MDSGPAVSEDQAAASDDTWHPRILFSTSDGSEQRHVMTRSGSEYFRGLWGALAPDSNIYRYQGLLAERRKHSLDLWRQMHKLATKYQSILAEPGYPQQVCVDRLHEALRQCKIRGGPCNEGEDVAEEVDSRTIDFLRSYLPLLEFLNEEVVQRGPFIWPSEWASWWRYARSTFLALAVLSLQVLVPVGSIYGQWSADTNHFNSPGIILGKLKMETPVCVGGEDAQLTTVVGSFIIVLFVFSVRLHADDEATSAQKSLHLPTDWFWLVAGNSIKAFCALAVCLALLLQFWKETGIPMLLLDSLGLMLILRLDYIVETTSLSPSQFRDLMSWTYLLLGLCPVRLSDVVNPLATKIEDLWHIEVNEDGQVQDVHCVLSAGAIGPPVCNTRLMLAEPQHLHETHTDDKDDDACSDDSQPVEEVLSYQVLSSGEGKHELPDSMNIRVRKWWTWVGIILLAMQILLPLAYVILNDIPCRPAATLPAKKVAAMLVAAHQGFLGPG